MWCTAVFRLPARTSLHLANRMSMLSSSSQDGENGSDSGYPSERRSEGDPNDHVDGVKIYSSPHLTLLLQMNVF